MTQSVRASVLTETCEIVICIRMPRISALGFIALIAILDTAVAAEFTGTLTKSDPIYEVEIKSGPDTTNVKRLLLYDPERYRIKSKIDDVFYDLCLLEAGDFISFEGEKLVADQVLEVNSIYNVGLKRILKKWVDNEMNVFDFQNFESLNVKYKTGLEVDWIYSLFPQDGATWDLQMESDSTVVIGNLRYFKSQEEEFLFLEFHDTGDGKLLFSRKLYPLFSMRVTVSK